MRRYWCFFVLSAVVMMTACQGFKSQVDADEADSLAVDSLTVEEDFSDVVVPKAADELFDDFVFNFAGNKKMQRERIVFPLKVIEGGKEKTIDRKDWKMEYFFMKQGYYTLLFDSEQHMEVVKDTTVTQAVVEKISFVNQTVRRFAFHRIRGTWMMTQIQEIPLSESHNATFLTFYVHFATNVEFQTKHLEPTVGFVGPDPDDDFAQMEGIITPDTWEAFAPQLPTKLLYNIVYGRPEKEGNRKVFVLRGIANGLELEMTFRKHGNQWKLSKLVT